MKPYQFVIIVLGLIVGWLLGDVYRSNVEPEKTGQEIQLPEQNEKQGDIGVISTDVEIHTITCYQNHAVIEEQIIVPSYFSQKDIEWAAEDFCSNQYGDNLIVQSPAP